MNDDWLKNRFSLIRGICEEYEVDPYFMYHYWRHISTRATKNHDKPLREAKKKIKQLTPLKKTSVDKRKTMDALKGHNPFDEKEYQTFKLKEQQKTRRPFGAI